MGEYAKAESLCRQVRNIRAKALGKEHPDYIQSVKNLAALHKDMNWDGSP